MCGMSSFKIGKETAGVHLGYTPNWLSFNDIEYCQDDKLKNKDKMREKLSSFTKEELVDAFIQMVDNGEED